MARVPSARPYINTPPVTSIKRPLEMHPLLDTCRENTNNCVKGACTSEKIFYLHPKEKQARCCIAKENRKVKQGLIKNSFFLKGRCLDSWACIYTHTTTAFFSYVETRDLCATNVYKCSIQWCSITQIISTCRRRRNPHIGYLCDHVYPFPCMF